MNENVIGKIEFGPPGNKGTDRLHKAIISAIHALRSYECGNSSPDLARSVANELEACIGTIFTKPEIGHEKR